MMGAIVPIAEGRAMENTQNTWGGDYGGNDHALALVHAPGVEMPETFAQFKVLSADIIDRIWAQLKGMVEEDSADLVRRQRQRDERYRLLMKLMPNNQAKAQFLFALIFLELAKSTPSSRVKSQMGESDWKHIVKAFSRRDTNFV